MTAAVPIEPFEQPHRELIISTDRAAEYAADTGKAAAAITALKGSDGWAIFISFINLRRQEIYRKDDYPTIEAFRGDRVALNIIDDSIGELDDLVEDADAAVVLFNKLAGAENQTPSSTIDLSTGGSKVEG